MGGTLSTCVSVQHAKCTGDTSEQAISFCVSGGIPLVFLSVLATAIVNQNAATTLELIVENAENGAVEFQDTKIIPNDDEGTVLLVLLSFFEVTLGAGSYTTTLIFETTAINPDTEEPFAFGPIKNVFTVQEPVLSVECDRIVCASPYAKCSSVGYISFCVDLPPVNETISSSTEKYMHTTVDIYDSRGCKVFSKTSKEQGIFGGSSKDLLPGVYTVRATISRVKLADGSTVECVLEETCTIKGISTGCSSGSKKGCRRC